MSVVVVGIGQLGGVFARGFLKTGRPVVPVVRGMAMDDVALQWPAPELVLVAVAERDLSAVLSNVPRAWRDRIGLLQNELLPPDWRDHQLMSPTVMSVWFEKRNTFEPRVLRSSPVFGPRASLFADALAAFDIPVEVLVREEALVTELVVKNAYILSKNVAGLDVGGTGRELWSAHAALAEALVDDALALQTALTGRSFDRDEILQGVRIGFDGGPDQKNQGRTAAARLARALALADAHQLAVPTFRRIAEQRLA